MPALLQELTWRELLQDQTPGLAERLAKGPITAYVGFDPTAKSLQVGNLIPIMLLAHLQRSGGHAIVVLGGGTGLIGDPSGKQTERPLLAREVLANNLTQQRRQFTDLFRHLDLASPEFADNAEWLEKLNLVEFLRDYGKYFTLSYMLQKESVKARLEEGISYTEFSYMLLQAYDFLTLFDTRSCELQMGGSDQWGNMTAGTELIRRVRVGKEAHALSAPLITTAAGQKFGKTEDKSVWLDQGLTAPVQFYNFWVNTDDRDVERYLRMFTFKTQDEIRDLMRQHASNPGARTPHHALAWEMTRVVHSQAAAEEMRKVLRDVFSEIEEGDIVLTIERLAKNLPPKSLRWDRKAPPKAEDLFVAAGLATSKGDARRLMSGKGLYLNGRVPKAGEIIDQSEIKATADGNYILLQKGKKTFQPLQILGLD